MIVFYLANIKACLQRAVLQERGCMPARTFVLIFKGVARPNLCEPPPSQSRHHVVGNVSETLSEVLIRAESTTRSVAENRTEKKVQPRNALENFYEIVQILQQSDKPKLLNN